MPSSMADPPHETHAQTSPVSSSAMPPFDPETFVLDDLTEHGDPQIFVEAVKHRIKTHIFTTTETPPPPKVAEALTDKVVYGHFKYDNPDSRMLRDTHHNIDYSHLPDTKKLPPLTEDASPDVRLERALVKAITTYFHVYRGSGPSLSPADYHDVSAREERCLPREYASAYISDLVHLVFISVSGDNTARVSAVTNLVVGIPSTFSEIEQEALSCNFAGRHRVTSVVDVLYWIFLESLVLNTLSYEEQPIYSGSGFRWKSAMQSKVAFWILEGRDCNIIYVASRFVELDFAHNRIEAGLALSHPVLGSAIVSPMFASALILHEMAGCVQERKDLEFEREYETRGIFPVLQDSDKGVKCNILGMDVEEESMVSMNRYFRKGELATFLQPQTSGNSRILISRHGIALYFPKSQGPWADCASSKGKGMRDAMKLVLRTSDDERSAVETHKAIEEKSRRVRTNWLSECPVSEDTKKRFGYIINKPGRALVRRRGIRGNYGRIIALLLMICGSTVAVLDFAERGNWLEQVFDGAQVASLLAAVTVAVIFLLSGTLLDTLDVLAGNVEVQDVEQLCKLTGLDIEELQGVLTYARGTLHWLSEHGASYCRARKLGPIVMTQPLNVYENAETKYSVVVDDVGDDLAAVWIMQGRMSRIEKSGAGDGALRLEDMAFEARTIQRRGYSGVNLL